MTAVLEKIAMARPKGRPKTDRDDVSVKVDRSIANKAKLIVAHEGISGGIAALLTEILQGPIDRRYLKMLHELEKETKE